MADIASTDFAAPYIQLFSEYVSKNKMDTIFKMGVIVHTKDKDLGTDDHIYIHALTITRDYENNVGDYIEAKISVPPGTFIEDIYPHMQNCEITIRTRKQYTNNGKPWVSSVKYKAIFLKDKNAAIPNAKHFSKHDLNQMQPFIITFQLIDRSVEAMRIKTTSGSFSVKGVDSVNEALATILSSESSKVLVENKPAIDFIHVYDADNPGKLTSLTMPSYSRVVEIPDYIQERSIGVYTSGLGHYIQKCMLKPGKIDTGMWVFPLYGPEKKKADIMEIYCPTQEGSVTSLPGAIYQDGRYIILAYKPTFQENDKETKVMSTGTGFRAADASKMMSKPVTVSPKGPIFERNKLNTEIVFKEREDGINFAVNKGNYFNTFAMAAEITKDKANFLTIQVPNLDHDVIRPGMNVYISMMGVKPVDDGKEFRVRRAYNANVLQAIFSYSNNNPNPLVSSVSLFTDMTCHSTLKLVVEEKEETK